MDSKQILELATKADGGQNLIDWHHRMVRHEINDMSADELRDALFDALTNTCDEQEALEEAALYLEEALEEGWLGLDSISKINETGKED